MEASSLNMWTRYQIPNVLPPTTLEATISGWRCRNSQNARACPRRRADKVAWGFGCEVGRDVDFAGIDLRSDAEF